MPPLTLMTRAGRAVARLVVATARPASPVLVLTGGGNNGGDGWVAARELHRLGWAVRVWEVRPAQTADAQQVRAQALADGVQAQDHPPWPAHQLPLQALEQHGLMVIDALLGLGARQPLAPPFVQAIRWLESIPRSSRAFGVISVDLPSGLDADTGQSLTDPSGQPCTVQADHTLSLLTLKPGLFMHQGRNCVGRVWFDPLDTALDRPPPDARLATAAILDALRRARLNERGQARHEGHKGTYGDVWLVGGAVGMVGALQLAARAALHAGAGRVHRVGLPPTDTDHSETPRPGAAAGPDPDAPEVMTPPWSALHAALNPDPVAAEGKARGLVVVAGCGGGAAMGAVLPDLLHRAPRLVLDADALNAVARDPGLQARLAARAQRGLHSIITPHPLEAARLLQGATADVQAQRLKAAQALADRYACTVVLKGSGTVVASPQCTPWINGSGNVRLATGGTGDVLAGWLGGAWAAAANTPLHDLTAASVHLHGLAADRPESEGRGPVTAVLPASDLIREMARELMRAPQGHHR